MISYIKFLEKDIKNMQLLEKQIKINIDKYMENKDMKYIEFLNKNMQKLLRLKQTTTKYYNKTNFKNRSFRLS
mgnify:CR=1 FL=1